MGDNGGLTATPQLGGLAWLQFLREDGFGGILADDMGLEKTIQTLAHILCEKEAGRLDAPALVVAPTSLMPNWQAEAARFAPGLRVLLLHGKERAAQYKLIARGTLEEKIQELQRRKGELADDLRAIFSLDASLAPR